MLQLILKDYSLHIHFRFSESGCFWLTCNDCFCDCLSVLEYQPASDLVSKQESRDCPGGVWVENGSSVGLAPPLAVLFGHLRGQIVLTEPPLNCVVFDCGECGWENRSGADDGTFFRVGRFFHDTLGMLMVLVGISGKYHTFSAHHGC